MFSSQAPAADRPIPLRRRAELEFVQTGTGPHGHWAVKDPLTLEYHELEARQQSVLVALDGTVSLNELKWHVNRLHPVQPWSLPDLQRLLLDFHRRGLVVSERIGQAATYRQRRYEALRQRLQQLGSQVLSFRLPGWNPAPFLDRVMPFLRWIYSPWAVALWTLSIVGSWLLLLVHFHEFQRRLPDFESFFGWHNLGVMWVTLLVTKVFHEFGHALTCHYYGRRCHGMGVLMMVFSPTLYCDVSDSWLLPNRWQRIWIGAGGMMFELFLASLATYLWWWTQPGWINHLALNIVFVCAVSTVVFNANPLLRFDGYYMLADYLGISNLRSKADRLLDRWIARWCCGYVLPPDPSLPTTGQFSLAAYAVAATVYSWMVMSGILLFLYSWLKPQQLQSVGMTLALAAILGSVCSLGLRGWKVLRMPQNARPRWARVALSGSVLIAVIAGILMLPVPWYLEAAAILSPTEGVELVTSVGGRIEDIGARPGDHVEQGTVLLRLTNEPLSDEHRRLETELRVAQTHAKALHAQSKPRDYAVALDQVRGLQERLAENADQLAQLTVRAPIAGTVVMAEPLAEPADEATTQLGQWHQHPLDRRNLGAWLEPHTSVAVIDPGHGVLATLYLPQAHRNELTPGDQVRLQFDAYPGQLFDGVIDEISEEHTSIVPRAVSTKYGGTLATTTRPDNEEELQELAYSAQVKLQGAKVPLMTGLRGRARLVVSKHTVAWWLLQTARRTFRFRL